MLNLPEGRERVHGTGARTHHFNSVQSTFLVPYQTYLSPCGTISTCGIIAMVPETSNTANVQPGGVPLSASLPRPRFHEDLSAVTTPHHHSLCIHTMLQQQSVTATQHHSTTTPQHQPQHHSTTAPPDATAEPPAEAVPTRSGASDGEQHSCVPSKCPPAGRRAPAPIRRHCVCSPEPQRVANSVRKEQKHAACGEEVGGCTG